MAANGLHISISAEPVSQVLGITLTNSMLTSLIVSGLLIAIAVAFRLTYNPDKAPRGWQNFVEFLLATFYSLIQGVTNSEKKTLQFYPFITTFFLFIVLNNWLGLLPGVGTIMVSAPEEVHVQAQDPFSQASYFIPQVNAATEPVVQDHAIDQIEPIQVDPLNPEESHDSIVAEAESHAAVPLFRAGTADLNMTLALAIISQLVAQYFGFAHVGFGYLKKFINFSNPIMFFVGILELLGEFTKVVSFAFRLFGNIFAGEVLLAVIMFLVPVVVPMPFYGLELFVGVIQGLVFAMLSLVFFNMATLGHDDH